MNLPALKTINTGTVILESDGTGSVLNVAALTSFTETGGWTYSTLQASNGGTVDDGSLASLSNVNLNVAGTGENVTLGSLTSFGSGNITVSGGATLSLPGVTSYTGNATTTTLEATGTGSTLTLANLASVTRRSTPTRPQTQFEALAGGTVTLPALQDDQYRHGGPRERRHRQHPERAGADQLHRDRRLDQLDPASLQRRHGCRSGSFPTQRREPRSAARPARSPSRPVSVSRSAVERLPSRPER